MIQGSRFKVQSLSLNVENFNSLGLSIEKVSLCRLVARWNSSY